jgi:F0F1-type ATP synthase assembly protein I
MAIRRILRDRHRGGAAAGSLLESPRDSQAFVHETAATMPETRHNRPSPAQAQAEATRLWRLAGMGGTMASEILAGALIGFLLDKLFKTAPTLLIGFTAGGVVIGLVTFLRSALRETKRDVARIHERDAAGGRDAP